MVRAVLRIILGQRTSISTRRFDLVRAGSAFSGSGWTSLGRLRFLRDGTGVAVVRRYGEDNKTRASVRELTVYQDPGIVRSDSLLG